MDRGDLPTELAQELADHPRWLPLESCICGLCFYCPDGWHHRDDDDEGGCSCTADCVLGDD